MEERKSSAHYQKLYRQRLRDQGLVKKEVWIMPSRASELQEIEKVLRDPFTQLPLTGDEARRETETMTTAKLWTTAELFEALAETELCKDGRAAVELINGEAPCLLITMREYGDLPVFLTVMREYILVEALLWPVEDVKDPLVFNMEAMKSSKLFPLSCISIDFMPGQESNYIMYGSLSATSLLSNVVFEIETLADNVIKATEAFEDHIKTAA